MSLVSVVTPQNVEVDYELSGSVPRIMALVIDQIILIVTLIILSMIIVYITPYSIRDYVLFLVLIPLYLFYSPFFEMVNFGQTPGKRLMGIKVVRIDGQEVGWMQALSRWVFRVLDIYITAGGLALLLINSNERRQRLGDIMGGSMVIRDARSVNVSLDRILNLKTIQDYEIRYPTVTRLEEEDVVFIKSVLERAERYGNEAHREAVKELTKHLSTVLNITPVEKRNKDFLRNVVNDYVVLTR